ncbi:MAG TPA: MATE family efflux transporter [Burkholderiales bacterium]|nr:MATE family efflux transporter [Burkholderiales bacterium]
MKPPAPSTLGRRGVTHRAILAIAGPIMISNVSTPLLGVVDTGVVGQLPDPAYIGAVALGALVFNFVFWGFGFLRMGTTGLTAQAFGAADRAEIRASLGRAVLIALAVGTGLIVAQWPIREVAFALLEGSSRVEGLARDYYDIRIWAAPATLTNYALLGWFIGLGRTRVALALQLVLNITNMLLDALLVLGLDLGVKGVAWGTLVAEVVAAATGLVLAARQLRGFGGRWDAVRLLAAERIGRTVAVNRDIMIRSLALIFIFSWFMGQGAKQGNAILAVNAVLMNIVAVAAYFLDGLAFAAEALVGKAVGEANRAGLSAAARMTTWWAAGVAVLASVVAMLLGPTIVGWLTVDETVRAAARVYLPWAALVPLAGVWCFQLDGIFIGATRAAEMRNAMLMSVVIFLVGWWLLRPWGNHGLWAALYVHYAARTGTLLCYFPALLRSVPV